MWLIKAMSLASFSEDRSLSAHLLQVIRGLPRLLFPSGAQVSAVLAMLRFAISSQYVSYPSHLRIVTRFRFGLARKFWLSFSYTSCGKHPVCSCLRLWLSTSLPASAPYSKTAITLVLKVHMVMVLKLYFDHFTTTTSSELKNFSAVFIPKLKITVPEFSAKSILRNVSFDKRNEWLSRAPNFFRAKITVSPLMISPNRKPRTAVCIA